MKCPQCKSRMKCFFTQHVDDFTTYREYVCMLCKIRYASGEKLELEPKGDGVPKFVESYYESNH